MSKPETNSLYCPMADVETASDDYASRFSGAAGKWFLDVQADIVLDMLQPHPQATVLDVGGGHGQLAFPLSAQGYDVTVLGSAPECMQRIQKEVVTGKMKYLTGSLLELPFAANQFDVVISFRLVPHCEEWEQLIAEMSRVASQMIIIDYPTSQSLNCLTDLLFGAKKKIEKNTRPYTLFKHCEIADACRRGHCVVEKRVHQFFLPMVLHRAMKCRSLSCALEKGCRMLGLTRHWGSPVILQAKPDITDL